MDREQITVDMTVAEVLERVPNAASLFQKYGINPVIDCGPMVRILRMEELPAHCKVQELEALMEDLNAAVEAEQ